MSLTHSPTSWPAFLIGLILLTYWLRVLQMVMRSRRATGRAANFVPPEPLGRVVRIVWIPVVVLWVLTPMVTPFLAKMPAFLRPAAPLYFNHPIAWAAFAVAVAAFAATWVCWHKMGESWRMGIDPTERTRLIFSGPYAYVRHPIYALSSVLAITAIVAVPSPLMVVVGALHLLCLQWEARREERYLVLLHGAPYVEYTAGTGRFIPRFPGAHSAGTGRTTVPR